MKELHTNRKDLLGRYAMEINERALLLFIVCFAAKGLELRGFSATARDRLTDSAICIKR